MKEHASPPRHYHSGERLLCCVFLAACLCADALAEGTADDSAPNPGQSSTNGALILGASLEAQKTLDSATHQGVVTWIDPDRQLVVLQDGERSTALRVDLPKLDFASGDWVELEGKESPLIVALPDYPDKPAGFEISSSFEAPTNWSNFFVTRMRGYLHPPVTGNFTFWIASDDSSELWLSDDADAAKAQKIAVVATGRYTRPADWSHYPSQKSRPIMLQAGGSYYIEAIQHDSGGDNCLSVAWQGPGIKQSVIDGRFLSPFVASEGAATAAIARNESSAKGILREYWTNFYSADLSVLQVTNEFISNLRQTRVVSKGEGKPPEPLRIRPAQVLQENQNFRLVETVAHLSFYSRATDGVEAELSEWPVRIRVRIPGVDTESFAYPKNALLRVRGVCEASRNADGGLRINTIWVNDPTNVTWADTEENWSQYKLTPIHLLVGTNASLHPGQSIRARGSVVAQETNGAWRIQGDDIFQGYSSSDGANWTEIGPPIEFAISNTALAGFAIASHHTGDLAVAEFDHISGLSGAMQGVQIGNAPHPGSFDFTGDSCKIRGGGWNIWNVSDEFYYVFQRLEGEGAIAARLISLKTTDQLGKAALMIRETLDGPSVWAAVVRMPLDRKGLQARRETEGKVAGSFVVEPGQWMKLTRQCNSFLIRPRNGQRLLVGESIDVLGVLSWQNDNVLLSDAIVRAGSGAGASMSQPTSTGVSSLPNGIADVRSRESAFAYSLTNEVVDVRIRDLVSEDEKAELEARVNVRFRIRGVVTFNDLVAGEPLFFIQDDSEGCLVRFWTGMPRSTFEVGKQVELIGTVAVRGVMPEFSSSGCAVFGNANMPQPLKYPFESALMERRRGQWSEIEGVGRVIHNNGELTLMTREGAISVFGGKGLAGLLAGCVDSMVRVRGVFWNATKPMLLVPGSRFIEIEESAPPNPFAIPVSSIASLLDLSQEPWSARRRKIAGVVTCKRANLVFVQDKSAGICLETEASPEAEVGDSIAAVGFLSERAFGFEMSNAVLKRTGKGALPKPIELSAEDGLDRSQNNLTVALDAVLLQKITQQGIQFLDLQSGQRAFRAILPVKDGILPSIANGSKIRVTGISQIESVDASPNGVGAGQKPLVATLEVLLRSPADVVMLQRPPWWNWKYTAALIGLSVFGAITSMIWIRTLRRRVEQRTGELRETMGQLQKETQVSATLAERHRVAGEIHDSVEQGLSAIIMQMDTAAKLVGRPDEVGRHLDMARDMAGFSRAELHHAVWGLQSPLLENADLPTALKRVAQDVSAGNSIRADVEISGEVRSLPPTVEHHLLRAGQEAITNAVKHGHPSTIQVTLNYATDSVRLCVRDDGCGFDPQAASVGISRFGLKGLHTRTKKINGSLTISSQPGKGASVEIIVPLNKPGSHVGATETNSET